MDYDDNDLQGRNLQLTGEGSSKLSPVLRPYALPKFDFDDSLHGHLRFDSLVENEVFLGIPSQEDNQWIEDFSRGSSGIEFSSGATESCSISRRNNVWSEATSSESVEMLLKSVGQEERSLEETVIEESDAGDQQCRLTKVMEPNSTQNDKMEDSMHSQPAVPLDVLPENFSGFNVSVGVEHPHIECTSRAAKAEPSLFAGSGEVDSITLSENCDLIASEENEGIDRKFDASNQMEVDSSLEESLNVKIGEIPSGSGIHISNKSSSSLIGIASPGVLNNQKTGHAAADICSENPDDLPKDISGGVMERFDQMKVSFMVDHLSTGCENVNNKDTPQFVSSELESIVDHTTETDFTNLEEPSSLPMTKDSELKIAEERKEDVCSTEPCQPSNVEGLVSLEDPEILLQVSMHKEEPVTYPGDGRREGKITETGTSACPELEMGSVEEEEKGFGSDNKMDLDGQNIEFDNARRGTSACLELEMGSVQKKEKAFGIDNKTVSLEGQNVVAGNIEEISACPELGMSSAEEKEKFLTSDDHIDRGASSEAYLLPGVESKLFEQGDEGRIKFDGDLAGSTAACSLAVLPEEQPSNTNSKGGNDTPGIRKAGFTLEDWNSPRMLAGSEQLNKKDRSFEEEGVHSCEQDVHFHDRGVPKLPTVSSNMGCDVVGSTDNDKRVETLCLGEGIEGNMKAHGSEFDNTTVNIPASEVVVEDMNLSSSDTLNGIPLLSGIRATADEATSHNHGYKSRDKNEEMDTDVPRDASLSDLKASLQVPAELDPVSDGPVPEAEKASQSEQAAVAVGNVQVRSVTFSTTVKEVEDNEAVGIETHKGTSIENALVEVSDAVLAPNKCELPSETVSGSTVGPCHSMGQKDDEAMITSGSDKNGKISHSTEVGSSDAQEASLPFGSQSVTDSINEDGDKSTNLVTPEGDTHTIISGAELLQSEKVKVLGIKQANRVKLSEVTCNADGIVKPSSLHKGNVASIEEKSFTFEVSPSSGLSQGEISKGWHPFPSVQACKISKDVEGSPLTSGDARVDLKMVQEMSRGSPQASGGVISYAGAKGTPERKTRRTSGKAAGKETTKKGNHVKETTPVKQSERGNKSMILMGSPGTVQPLQYEELKSCGDLERSIAKQSSVVPVPTSNLPDLNTSIPPPFFQQPFTDLQQVQLRAQIFVYGSLIQGAIPDEACMHSAFGPSDGGKSLWELAWRASVERVHGLKPHANNLETPMQSRSGSRASEQQVKHGSLQSKVLSSSVGRVSNRGNPSPVNPIVPLSSPLWNASTPCDGLQSSGIPRGTVVDYHQSLSPLHPYQTPAIRNFIGHGTSWLSQAPFPGTWVASPHTSAFDTNVRFPMFHNTEPVKLTPVKESSSCTKHPSILAVPHTGGSSVSTGTVSLPDVKKITGSSSQHSTEPKPRKRKKLPVSEGLGQIPLSSQNQLASLSATGDSNNSSKTVPVAGVGQMALLAQSQTESVSAPVINNLFSASIAVTTPAPFACTSSSGKFHSAPSPSSSSDHPRSGNQNVEKNIISEEVLTTVKEAMLQSENAAAHAATAISHCNDVWSQLGKQKNSGLMSDVEAKLASAAVAIAAAASVAKAAAAAAKIAANVAVQAKLMADEVSFQNKTGIPSQSTAASLSSVVSGSGQATPLAILKAGDGSLHPASIIASAREAARKRVEATSAASKHAENLDAIVKAAELAAEAVSQAGKIVSIGDPLSVSELVEYGPEGYWKKGQVSSDQGAKLNIRNSDQPTAISVEGLHNISAEQSKEGLAGIEIETVKPGMSSLVIDISGDLMEGHLNVVDGISGSVTNHDNSSRGKRDRIAPDLAKTIGVIPESEIESRTATVIAEDEHTSAPQTMIENDMKEGCLVEVFKDGGNYKAAWYLANILSLKDGKAFVCYTELESDEGTGKLKEWVPIEGDGHTAPILRIAHPMTTVRSDGTRKRRRAVVMDHSWSVGDRVDAWMQDCWCEGVVTEKNKNDETKLTIHFPVLGETSIARAWHLRPTLFWKDGEWIEMSSARGGSLPQGDTPQEKRLKLGSPAAEGKGKEKMTKGVNLVETRKHEDSRQLPLSTDEQVFNVGKSTRHENKLDAPRTIRTGLQKEGSRVVIGIPKPGKKRKFMEVSKHFVTEQNSKNNSTNDSVKFARYLMPHGSGSRGWKNNTKIDAKEKHVAEEKPKVLRSRKPQIVSSRTLPHHQSLPHDAALTDQIENDAIGIEENDSDQQNLMEFRSVSGNQEASDAPPVISSLGLQQVAPKKVASSNSKFERLNKGKLAPAGARAAKVEVQDKSISEVVEPRRSNRRIQPTSRLLEGLQSSLIISKIPGTPHDKSHRSQSRNTFKGNTSHG